MTKPAEDAARLSRRGVCCAGFVGWEHRLAAFEDRGRLWRRLVLVAITGAVPLFLVSLFSVHSSYSPEVHFSQQERRGVAFLSRLDVVFEALSRYTESIAATRAGRAG